LVRNPPGKNNSRLKISGADLTALRAGAGKNAVRQGLVDRLAHNQLLTRGQRQALLNWRIQANRTKNRALAGALKRAQRNDHKRFRSAKHNVAAARSAAGNRPNISPGSALALSPGGGGGDGGLVGPGGMAFPVPPGIDPGGGAVALPENPAEPQGRGIVTALDPDSIDPGWGPDDDDDAIPPVPDEEDDAALDAVWQTTRFIRLSNGYTSRITVNLTYQTLDANEDPVEGSVEVELAPGEVVDVYQGNWQVNAQRISFSAVAEDGAEWERWSKRWLELVPERDEKGTPGYASPRIETKVVAFR
jgi:hypothetical protein